MYVALALSCEILVRPWTVYCVQTLEEVVVGKWFKYLVVHSSHGLKIFPLPIAISFIIFRGRCLLLAITGRKANGGMHCSLSLAKFWNSSGEKPHSELLHTKVLLSLLEQVMAVRGAGSAEGLSETCFADLSIAVFTKTVESQVLLVILLICWIVPTLCNFYSTLRNMLWFLTVIANNCNEFIC